MHAKKKFSEEKEETPFDNTNGRPGKGMIDTRDDVILVCMFKHLWSRTGQGITLDVAFNLVNQCAKTNKDNHGAA